MCKVLKVTRSLVYYIRKEKTLNLELEKQIFKIFKKSRNNYGSRKIKKELEKIDIIVSLRKIRTIMKKNGLVSNYTIKQFKVIKSKYNEDGVENILNREFNREKNMDVIVSDLTYVNVAGKWNYICLILDLYNREIVGYAAGRNKTASLVYKAFSTIRFNLNKVSLFHTDRGN